MLTLTRFEGLVAPKNPAKARKLPIDDTASLTGAATTVPAWTNTDTTVLPKSGYLTAGWVKRRYQISNSTLYKWIADKRFVAPVHIGPRAVRWRAEDLAAFEASVSGGE